MLQSLIEEWRKRHAPADDEREAEFSDEDKGSDGEDELSSETSMDASSDDEGENNVCKKACLECSRRPQPPSSNGPNNSSGNNARETNMKDDENKGSDSEDEDTSSKEGNNVGIP
jgi:hypothetical protein